MSKPHPRPSLKALRIGAAAGQSVHHSSNGRFDILRTFRRDESCNSTHVIFSVSSLAASAADKTACLNCFRRRIGGFKLLVEGSPQSYYKGITMNTQLSGLASARLDADPAVFAPDILGSKRAQHRYNLLFVSGVFEFVGQAVMSI